MKQTLQIFAVLLSSVAIAYAEFEREDYEEPAGPSFQFVLNPQDRIYGIHLGDGTWLKDWPVFGDFFLGIFQNGIEDSLYSDIGLTIRIMPRWKLVPFVGGGGSYNYSLSGTNDTSAGESSNTGRGTLQSRGDSYFGYHVETGFRLWMDNNARLIEIMARQTWSSLQGDRDYWLIGISVGAGI